ncbi:single-stranded-DNA-specific exonuclease RecJ, partial [Patescibacteria group bacterium]|nr:single-stranded-DNA-specific exonuclease RecJ [Patescibacteria group bacterium]
IKRIRKAIENGEDILVYGDYDADGICATTILWETLFKITKKVLPYIPERLSEGYGLNENSIKNLKLKNENLSLIITVDHGITAGEKIKFAKNLGIDIIVCDHHQIGKEKPVCEAVVHTDQVCAAAISWFVSRELANSADYLDLVAIASIADLESLVGINRSFVKFGLEALNKTCRLGILSILEEAGIEKGKIGTYEVGFIIAPRLNAMGRMGHALESLRLICTNHKDKAKGLAQKLGLTNKERQELTEEITLHARNLFLEEYKDNFPKLIIVSHESYKEGVIGLAAGKLTEEFYRPAIVISKGGVYSKASARSISGFNIIEAIRAVSELIVEAGGHPMAAGFTVETVKIEEFKERILKEAEKQITEEILEKSLKIDLELPFLLASLDLWKEIQNLTPFGLGNPEPVFAAEAAVKDLRKVGATGKHLKIVLGFGEKDFIEGIGFNLGERAEELALGDRVKVVYNLTLNEWNGNKKIEAKIKDIKLLNDRRA